MFDSSKVVDRRDTWRTQWDCIVDHFDTADLLPFTISDMDFATTPCTIETLGQRLIYGVFGYSRWKNDEFLATITHWLSTQYYTAIDPQSMVYGPSIVYMASKLIRQWSETGEGVVIHAPAYGASYKVVEGNQYAVMPIALEKQPDGWLYDVDRLEAVLVRPECKIMLSCSLQDPTRKMWAYSELEIMTDLCERHGMRVISDEVRMDMVWGEQPHIPWSNVACGDWALLTSGSKSSNIPALTGAYEIMENSSNRDTYLSALKGRDEPSFLSMLMLATHIAAYQQGTPWLDTLRVYLRDDLAYIADRVNATSPELNWQISQSTYLAWLGLRPSNIGDSALQKMLIEQEKIAIMPGYTYGEKGRGFVRLDAGYPRSKLEKSVAGLIDAIRAVS